MTFSEETFDDIPATEITGVYIRSYKNLENLWLPWSPAMVLVGGNGVGKSNLLECLALLMGSPTTRDLVAKRVPAEQSFDISVVATEAADVMLLNPELSVRAADMGADPSHPLAEAGRATRWLSELAGDGRWWLNAGWQSGDDKVSALLARVDEATKVALEPLVREALVGGKVRYWLRQHGHGGTGRDGTTQPMAQRRTLVVERRMIKGAPLGDTCRRDRPSGDLRAAQALGELTATCHY